MPCLPEPLKSLFLALPLAVTTTFTCDRINAEDQPWEANPEHIRQREEQRKEFNYREDNVPEYSLPDPLVTLDGTRVATPLDWNETRRPELLQLFRLHVYGKRPDADFAIAFREDTVMESVFAGKATGKGLTATITVAGRSFSFPFVVFLPHEQSGPVPAIIHINNRYFTPLEKAVAEEDPFWPARSIVDRGYATASFHTSHVDPDRKDGYDEGIRSFFADGSERSDDDWGSLSAWGWAASRILDYLDSQPGVDGSRVALVGHSRGGKSALWAACEDSRFAIAYSNNSGCGGAALSRRAYGETVARITTSFPHWFCRNFAAYSGDENQLPVDQHQIMSLIAPRALYVTSADADLWADPRGEYLSIVGSAPVFELLGETSIQNKTMPPLDQPRIAGQTGYHIRTGKHNLEKRDWDWFLDFADSILTK